MSGDSGVPLGSLGALVGRVWGCAPEAVSPMPGGASTRRFFRVRGSDGQRAVAMYFPDASRPDEITRPDAAPRRWPFLEVRDLLASRGIRVPAVLGEDCGSGWLLVEDLGDATLANHLVAAPTHREELYRSAVRDLAEAQRRLAALPADSVVASRAFDRDLLRWEIDHFREWGLEARGVHLSDADRRTFDTAADHLSALLSSLPRCFVHRDYQSRNLMVRETGGRLELWWIDFQDALLGPRIYDLVALLNDSYQTFTREFVEARLQDFASAAGLDERESAELLLEFDLCTVQRKLKDAGRFVFIDRTKGNSSFLSFVEPTLQKARASLDRVAGLHPTFAALQDLLSRITTST